MEYTEPYYHGIDDSASDRIHLYKDPAAIFQCQHYSSDFNGKPDRTSAFPLTDTGGYGNLDPVKCCWYWRFFRKLLGPAGGYRYGNLVAAVMISMFCCKVKKVRWQTAFIIIVGIPVIYLFGAVQMKYVTNQPWGAIMIQAVLPFIPLDIVKCFVAAGIAKPLRRLFPAD